MNARGLLKDVVMIIFGSAIAAASVYFFMVPSHITVGSVSGLAIILENFIPLKISVITFILNGLLLIVGFLFVGRDFGAKTVCTSLLIPVFMGFYEILYPNLSSIMEEPFLDMICYIFLVSVGQAILFQNNASSGGLDIVGKIINKYFHVELGKAISMAGMCVALSSIFFYEKKIVVLSVLGTYLSGMVLDHFIFGFNIKKRVCIMSKREDEIVEFILNDLHSGATIYEPIGAYSRDRRREVIAIVTKNEYSKLMNFINKIDKDAFVTIYTVNEVLYKPKVIGRENA